MQSQFDGFVVCNPPVPIWVPSAEKRSIRGYVLSRHHADQPFFVLQLTERVELVRPLDVGTMLAVLEVSSLAGLAQLLPRYLPDPVLGARAEWGWEVVLEPYQEIDSRWQYLIHARRVSADKALIPIGRPPSFPMLMPLLVPVADAQPPKPRKADQIDESIGASSTLAMDGAPGEVIIAAEPRKRSKSKSVSSD